MTDAPFESKPTGSLLGLVGLYRRRLCSQVWPADEGDHGHGETACAEKAALAPFRAYPVVSACFLHMYRLNSDERPKTAPDAIRSEIAEISGSVVAGERA